VFKTEHLRSSAEVYCDKRWRLALGSVQSFGCYIPTNIFK